MRIAQELSRRSVFIGMLLAFAGLVHPNLAGSATDAAFARKLGTLFPRARESARALGAACLELGPCRLSADALVCKICPDPAERTRLGALTAAELAGWLQRRMCEDFTADRMVRVQGWMLSETEARLYALLATV